jgi:hypothetical protein
MKKWANELDRAFSKEEVQMTKKTWKKKKKLTISDHERNTSQNHIKILPPSC